MIRDILELDPDYVSRILPHTPAFWDDPQRTKFGRQIATYLRETVLVQELRARMEHMAEVVVPRKIA